MTRQDITEQIRLIRARKESSSTIDILIADFIQSNFVEREATKVSVELLKGKYTGGLAICVNGYRVCGCEDGHYSVIMKRVVDKKAIIEGMNMPFDDDGKEIG